MARTPEQWQKKAVDEAGGKYVNTLFEIAFGYGTSGGVFAVAFGGVPSLPIGYPCTDETFQSTLELHPFVQEDGVLVTGEIGGPFLLEMVGANMGKPVTTPTVDGSQLIEPQEVQVTLLQRGKTNDFSALAKEEWDEITDAVSSKHRYLLVKKAILDKILGEAANEPDVRTGNGNIVEAKMSQRYTQFSDLLDSTEKAIEKEERDARVGNRRATGGYIQPTTPNGQGYGVMYRDPITGRLR